MTNGQSASPSWYQGPISIFLLLFRIIFRQLQVCYFVAPSLMRGRVCNSLLLLVLAIAGHRTQDHILLSQFLRLPQRGGPGHHIYIPVASLERWLHLY
jgi:hypothetical protein